MAQLRIELWLVLFALVTQATSDSGAISTTDIEADVKTIWEAGGISKSNYNDWKAGSRYSYSLLLHVLQTDVMTTVGGINVTSIINPLGAGTNCYNSTSVIESPANTLSLIPQGLHLDI